MVKTMNKIKVMIADDHELIRKGLKQLLELEGDIEVISEVGDGVECLDKLRRMSPDVLLLDINMPKQNGIEVLQKIRDWNDNTKVLILTVHNEIEYLIKAVDIGVNGYLMKDSTSEELRKAIYSVMDNENYIQSSLIPLLNSKLVARDIDKEKIESLTRREMEVLIKITNGMSNKEIASTLNISERTVKNHISNIFKKIDLSDRTQAAVFAIRNNLIKL